MRYSYRFAPLFALLPAFQLLPCFQSPAAGGTVLGWAEGIPGGGYDATIEGRLSRRPPWL
jgi:hypothetical protein